MICFVVQWAILLGVYVFHWQKETDWFPVDVTTLLHVDFIAALILITLGPALRKTDPILLALIEVWKEYIALTYFSAYHAAEEEQSEVFLENL